MRAVSVAFFAVAVVLWIGVWRWTRVPDFVPLSDEKRARAIAFVRGEIASFEDDTPLAGGAFVSAWREGKLVARARGEGGTVGGALRDASAKLRGVSLAGARVKLDLVRGRSQIARALLPISIVPGVDGIAASLDGTKTAALLPDELFQEDLLAVGRPFGMPDVELGVDAGRVGERLADQLGLDWREWKARAPRLERLRLESIVEGLAPAPPPTRANLRAAARAGGRFLLNHLDADGRYHYEYDPIADRAITSGRYSVVRHAGTTWFLAQLAAATGEREFLDGAARALAWVVEQIPPGCDRGERLCLGDIEDETVDLGAAALALLAAAELERSTKTVVPEAQRLAAFLLSMQKPDGDFCHLHAPRDDRPDCAAKLLYYTGEAALALARSGHTEAAARAVDYLTGPAYAHFAGSFYFGEDHWTCLAADSLFDGASVERKKTWGGFCSSFGAFMRRMQFDDGSYGFGPMLAPHATPAGARSEAAISILRMERALGLAAAADTRTSIARAMRFLLSRQIRDDNAWRYAQPERARGGFTLSDARPIVRIDFVQHCGSAMLRAGDIDLLE